MDNSVSLPTVFQQYIHKSRYARYLWSEGRRENWQETIIRYVGFMKSRVEKLGGKYSNSFWDELEGNILNLKVMPSMRALMTSGEALANDNICSYNCAYTAIDTPRAFDEIMYILMNGAGIGFSVEQKYIDQLPMVAEDFHETDTTIVIPDSKMGWAKSFKELIHLLYGGQIPKMDYSKLRPAGAPLKTFGGRASGPEPYKELVSFTTKLFKTASGRRLTSLEAHDLVCKIASIIVSGGVRRSALISLSDLSDDRMRSAKMGQWYYDNIQRSLANNSWVINNKSVEIGIFMKEWLSLYESKSGERGIYSRYASKQKAGENGRRITDFDFGVNPCCLSGDTLVDTKEYGNITIKDLMEIYKTDKNILVSTLNIYKNEIEIVPVIAAQPTRKNAEIIELEIETDVGIKILKCTPDHPIYTNNRGYVRADELDDIDEMIILD